MLLYTHICYTSVKSEALPHELIERHEMTTQKRQVVSTFDPSVLCAWREQLREATSSPALKQQLVGRERELLPRFATHYTRLASAAPAGAAGAATTMEAYLDGCGAAAGLKRTGVCGAD